MKSKVEVIDFAMKNQSNPCINLNDSEVKKKLLQNEGSLRLERNSADFRMVVNVRWNKEKLFFNCSIVFLEKQEDGKWKCVMRFDDAHECRHADVDYGGRAKMVSGRFALIKVECPILSAIINSLPKDRADVWKIKLLDEIVIGNQKWKEFLNNPEKSVSL